MDAKRRTLDALALLGQRLDDEEARFLVRIAAHVEAHWVVGDQLLTLQAERDAALERGNRLAVRLADIESAGVATRTPAGVLMCARRGCQNPLPPPRSGAGAPRKLCLDCSPRRRPLKRPELADSWAEIVTANPMGRRPDRRDTA